MRIEDQELVKAVLAGQSNGFRFLVERYQKPIFRFVSGLLGHREEALDVTQETFLAAFSGLSGFDCSRASFSTWLFTIARNRSINVLKKSRPVAHEAPDAIEAETTEAPLFFDEFSRQLDQALAMLPTAQRVAFLLAEVEELPYAEIARIERTSLGTVKSRIHRAKQRLL